MNNISKLVISIVMCVAASSIAAFAYKVSNNGWYRKIEKPPFMLTDWTFIIIWGLFFVIMGFAFFLIWKEGTGNKNVKQAINIFIIHLILSAAWPWIFFQIQNLLVSLILMLIAVLLAIMVFISFRKVSKAASTIMLLYALWLLFNAFINFNIYQLNT